MAYLNSVVLLDFWVGETECSSVVGHNIRNFVLSKALSLDLAEFETGILTFNADRLETSLDVIEDAEVFVGPVNSDNILETKWELWVSSDLVVNLDQTFSLSADLDRLLAVECVLKSVLEKNGEWDAFTQFVWASRWAVGVHAFQLVQTPVGWSELSLKMLPGSSCLNKRSASELYGSSNFLKDQQSTIQKAKACLA